MLVEAQAFDRLLDLAPVLPPERIAALSDKIMMQAVRGPRIVAASPVPLTRPKPASIWKRHAAGISALAASLLVGVLAGQNAAIVPAVSEIATVVGIDSLSDGARVAATDETYVGIDEDML